eukprot:CAMPEP_0197863398 /NCGR_PEP_ID=MMETSP1438-20131217/40820_1 /TAXON_ID=1461541 /ORGANISM="Pterosperma sp., Strain CCMP1384" /LENGTH=265 /DNA_ID=CAMNT_0043481275 /DNA_START=259 /DNA_END=1056 /DNA_ORIENTATION=-
MKYESTSAKIYKESKANKVGLSYDLDGTLRSGAHDMKVFGLGFLRSISSEGHHRSTLTAMWHFYNAMEIHFDHISAPQAGPSPPSSPMAQIWAQFPELRRAPALKADLADLGVDVAALEPSSATSAYIKHINECANEDPDLLIGHFYCRYFADLFGGSMLGFPTRIALNLPDEPQFYRFPAKVEDNRQLYVEEVYQAINQQGVEFDEAKRQRIVQVAIEAFKHNAEVLTEAPHMRPGAALGVARVVTGFVWDKLTNTRGTPSTSK